MSYSSEWPESGKNGKISYHASLSYKKWCHEVNWVPVTEAAYANAENCRLSDGLIPKVNIQFFLKQKPGRKVSIPNTTPPVLINRDQKLNLSPLGHKTLCDYYQQELWSNQVLKHLSSRIQIVQLAYGFFLLNSTLQTTIRSIFIKYCSLVTFMLKIFNAFHPLNSLGLFSRCRELQ